MQSTKEVIVIRSMSSISSLGVGAAEIWANWKSDQSVIRKRTFSGKESPVAALSDVQEHLLNEVYPDGKIDRSARLAMFAASKLQIPEGFNGKMAVNIGSSRGATERFESLFSQFSAGEKIPPHTSPVTTLGNISSHVRHVLQQKSFCMSHSVTCSTAIQSIMNAFAWLHSGMADIFVAGAAEAPLTPFTLAQMNALKIYSSAADETYPCRPLEGIQNTMVLGEGAALFVLEKWSREKAKESSPLAVIESVGYSSELTQSLSGISAGGQAFQESMEMALQELGDDAEIDAIIMHAPGTKKGDQAEMDAIRAVFGEKIPYLIPAKWKTGHLLGASAAINVELAVHILQNQKVFETPYLSQKQEKPAKIRRVMINAAGFGGNAGTVVVKELRIKN